MTTVRTNASTLSPISFARLPGPGSLHSVILISSINFAKPGNAHATGNTHRSRNASLQFRTRSSNSRPKPGFETAWRSACLTAGLPPARFRYQIHTSARRAVVTSDDATGRSIKPHIPHSLVMTTQPDCRTGRAFANYLPPGKGFIAEAIWTTTLRAGTSPQRAADLGAWNRAAHVRTWSG